MDPPPSYALATSSSNPSSPESSKEEPPSYSAPTSLITAASLEANTSLTSSSSSWTLLGPEDCPTFTLDGCNIYSAAHPSRILYILSNAPAEATNQTYNKTYGVEKVYYKTRPSDSSSSSGVRTPAAAAEEEEVKRSRQQHIYDFTSSFDTSLRTSIIITGQRSSKFTFRKATLSPNGPSGASHFKSSGADKGSNIRVSPTLSDPRSKLSWKGDDRGKDGESRKLLAYETRGTRNSENKMVVMPRLEIAEKGLEERDVDFLVCCWCARVWRESLKETQEPMTWERFKRIAGTKLSAHDGATRGTGIWG